MRLAVVLFSAIALCSCSKDPKTPPGANAGGTIEFKVNGNLITMDNADVSRGGYVVFYKQLKGIAPETRYLLNAQKGANNYLVCPVVTDSLHEIIYHYDSIRIHNNPAAFAFSLNNNGQLSTILFGSDDFTIDISSFKNGRISGTFAGKFTPYTLLGGVSYDDRGSIVITEGKIDNVPIIY